MYGYPVLWREPWSILYLIHAGSLYFRYIFLDLGLMALMRGVPARVALSPPGFSSCAVLPALLVSCVLLCSCLGICLAACPSSSVSSHLYTSSRMLSKDPHPCTVMGGPIGAAGWWLVENKGRNQFTLGLLSSSFSPSPDDGSCAGVQTLISHLQRSSLAHLHHWTLSTPILFTNAILPSTPFHPNFSPWLQRTSWTISLFRWNIHYKPKMLLSSNSHLK